MLHALFVAFGAVIGVILAIAALPAIACVVVFVLRVAWIGLLTGGIVLLFYLWPH